MAVRRNPSGSWTAAIKQNGRFVGSKTFKTKREAQAWERDQKIRLGAGVDLGAGRVLVADRVRVWLIDREGMVSDATLTTDRSLPRLLPAWFLSLRVNAVTESHVERLLAGWSRQYAYGSVKRYRATLATFFVSCVRARLIAVSPVPGVPMPRPTESSVEMTPFAEDELEEVVAAVRERNSTLGDVVLILGWTGLRWGELRALRVEDFERLPGPTLRIRRSHSESRAVKGTKSGRSRRVVVAEELVPILERFARGKQPTDLLLTTDRGAQLHAAAFKRATDWKVLGRGRRLHDLRHTAICLWLARGVEPLTVKAWAGHESIGTTNGYVHYLGTSADDAGRVRLNAPRANLGQISREATA